MGRCQPRGVELVPRQTDLDSRGRYPLPRRVLRQQLSKWERWVKPGVVVQKRKHGRHYLNRGSKIKIKSAWCLHQHRSDNLVRSKQTFSRMRTRLFREINIIRWSSSKVWALQHYCRLMINRALRSSLTSPEDQTWEMASSSTLLLPRETSPYWRNKRWWSQRRPTTSYPRYSHQVRWMIPSTTWNLSRASLALRYNQRVSHYL